MDEVTKEFQDEVPWCMTFADGIILEIWKKSIISWTNGDKILQEEGVED